MLRKIGSPRRVPVIPCEHHMRTKSVFYSLGDTKHHGGARNRELSIHGPLEQIYTLVINALLPFYVLSWFHAPSLPSSTSPGAIRVVAIRRPHPGMSNDPAKWPSSMLLLWFRSETRASPTIPTNPSYSPSVVAYPTGHEGTPHGTPVVVMSA